MFSKLSKLEISLAWTRLRCQTLEQPMDWMLFIGLRVIHIRVKSQCLITITMSLIGKPDQFIGLSLSMKSKYIQGSVFSTTITSNSLGDFVFY